MKLGSIFYFGKYFISSTLKDLFAYTSALYERRIRIRLQIVWYFVSLFKVFGCFYVISVMTTDMVIDAGK